MAGGVSVYNLSVAEDESYIAEGFVVHNCRPWERRVLSLTGKTEGYPTVEAARAAGLYHNNCTHRHYLYVPGVSPERTAKANPKGYEQRQDQRRIERQIRQWKRRSAVAGNDRDRAIADRKVKFYRQKMDSFIEETGRLRQRNRERFIIPRAQAHRMPYRAKPHSIIDKQIKDGTIIQRRIYGADGLPKVDIDLTDHRQPKSHPTVPHVHDWVDGRRDSGSRELRDHEKKLIRDIKT